MTDTETLTPPNIDPLTQMRLAHADDGTECGCIMSSCETYRYALWRIWDQSMPLWLFVLLNPSKATETETDPTITRQIERAKRGGAGGIVVVNTGAVRETNSDLAVIHPDPIGPDNAYWVHSMLSMCKVHIAGWGPKAAKFGGDKIVKEIFEQAGIQLYALKINKDGSPQHPLYLPYDMPLIPLD